MTGRITTSTWARAKAAYLAGETAGAVCGRFRIGRSAFFAAAQTGGWRRTDRVASADAADAEPAAPGEALPCVDLAEAAMARASDAVMGGRLYEAQGWTRLAAELRRLALQECGQDSWTETLGHVIDQEAHGHYMADKLAEAAVDQILLSDSGPDSPDSLRTPVSAITHENNTLIAAGPDSVDYPTQTGLLASTALPRTFDSMAAWAELEIAKLEARDRGALRHTGGGP